MRRGIGRNFLKKRGMGWGVVQPLSPTSTPPSHLESRCIRGVARRVLQRLIGQMS